MVHKGDLKIFLRCLKNIDAQFGKVSLKHHLLWRHHNIVDELKAEGELGSFTKYSGFEFDDNAQRGSKMI
jgi:aconitate hydratase 2/2-methylisocitrate dehydratase